MRLDPKFGAALTAARQFLREAELVYQKKPKPLSPRLRTAQAVVDFVEEQIPTLYTEQQEVFGALSLNAKHSVTKVIPIAKGTVASVDVHPREAYRELVKMAACAAIYFHNHPSGDPEPSADDLALTARLRDAGILLGIPVLDHIIIAGDGFVSLADRGLL